MPRKGKKQKSLSTAIFQQAVPSLLLEKIKVWLKRSASIAIDVINPIRVGTLHLFASEKTSLLKNGAVRLTNLELRLLYDLMTDQVRL